MNSCFLLFFPIFSGINLLFFIEYKCELQYIDAIDSVWKKKPIYDISTIKKEGYEKYSLFNQENFETFCDCSFIDDYWKCSSGECSEIQLNDSCIEYSKTKSYFYKNKTLYVKYYDADYLELFSRVHNEENYFGLCKTGYKRCGYLDIFKNAFCIKSNEKCPINHIDIPNEEFTYEGLNYSIINQLYVSEKENATIFDIDKIFTQKDLRDLEKDKMENKTNKYNYFYNLSYTNDYIIKSDFAKENNLISKGEIPKYFNKSNLYLYHLVYPGNLKKYEITFRKIDFIRYNNRLIILFVLLFIKISMGISLYFLNEKNEIKILYIFLFIIVIILIVAYIIFYILSILFYFYRFDLHQILWYYEENIYKTNENNGSGITMLVFSIIFSLLDILVIIFAIIMLFLKSKCKIKKENYQENLDQIDQNEKLMINNTISSFDQ